MRKKKREAKLVHIDATVIRASKTVQLDFEGVTELLKSKRAKGYH